MDMESLTSAMGWPAFSGRISGKVPAVSFDDGVLDVGGEIEFDVFDGSIAVSGLSVERPFGVLPSQLVLFAGSNPHIDLVGFQTDKTWQRQPGFSDRF